MRTGFFGVTDLIKLKIMADSVTINSDMLADLIRRDLQSPEKLRMGEGTRYYESKHDILGHVQTYFLDGQEVEDLVKSNHKLPHSFHSVLVDQKTSYIVGNPVVVSVRAPDVEDDNAPTPQEQVEVDRAEQFQEAIVDMLEDNFDDVVSDWVVGASNKGLEWVHFYIDPEGELKYIICPAEQIIPIYDTQYEERLLYVLRFYLYDLIQEDGKMVQRYKAEWWDEKQVVYYAQMADGTFVHDPNYDVNPSGGHWYSFNTLQPEKKEFHSWGRVPFVALENNSKRQTDLQKIKSLIDAYDKVKSGWVNDLDDFQELVYVLKGYQAVNSEVTRGLSELGVFIKNLKNHKAITVEKEGDVGTLKAEIPVEAKERFLEITRKEIFYFGEGVDVTTKDFNSPSGIALKFLYSSLDLKANRMIRKLYAALREFMWFIVTYVNMTERTDYDPTELAFTVNKSVIFNEKEKIDGLVASQSILSRKTTLENHPYVSDVNEEISRLDADRERELEQATVDLANVPDAPAPPDGGRQPQDQLE